MYIYVPPLVFRLDVVALILKPFDKKSTGYDVVSALLVSADKNASTALYVLREVSRRIQLLPDAFVRLNITYLGRKFVKTKGPSAEPLPV
jgi:hypothetical protein